MPVSSASGAGHADDHAVAAPVEALDGVGDDRRVADALEGPVDAAAAGQVLGSAFTAFCVRAGRATKSVAPKRAGQLLLLREGVDGDDATGVADAGGLDDVEADAADAEHGHVLARLHVGPVEHRHRRR